MIIVINWFGYFPWVTLSRLSSGGGGGPLKNQVPKCVPSVSWPVRVLGDPGWVLINGFHLYAREHMIVLRKRSAPL